MAIKNPAGKVYSGFVKRFFYLKRFMHLVCKDRYTILFFNVTPTKKHPQFVQYGDNIPNEVLHNFCIARYPDPYYDLHPLCFTCEEVFAEYPKKEFEHVIGYCYENGLPIAGVSWNNIARSISPIFVIRVLCPTSSKARKKNVFRKAGEQISLQLPQVTHEGARLQHNANFNKYASKKYD